jgi:WS/DGAT/MGAT family acyltransferase
LNEAELDRHHRMMKRDPSSHTKVPRRIPGETALDRLSPLDVSNLRVEDRGLPMHIAALAYIESLPLRTADSDPLNVLQHLERRLEAAPRLRQILYKPSLGLGPPVWVDDPRFDIRKHVRAMAVPPPGNEAALVELCSRLNEEPLDRSHPLWEMWLLTGLEDGTMGLLFRLHHVVADGVAALALIGALLDPAPEVPAPVTRTWTPRPVPSAQQLLADDVRRLARAAGRSLAGLRYPAHGLRHLREAVRQGRHLLGEGSAPRLSLNRQVGEHRRLILVRADLERARAVAHAHRGTVNDVVLAAVAGGARRLLEHRGELRPGLAVKVSVAASLRGTDGGPAIGNRVGIIIVPVPVDDPDASRTLQGIARTTADRKRRPAYQPAGRIAQRWMVRVMSHQHLVNLLASNLPGPPFPMYLAGARVLEVFQVGVVQGNITVSVGVLSYAGQLNFDIVGDADAVPDLPLFAGGVSDTLEELGVIRRPPYR